MDIKQKGYYIEVSYNGIAFMWGYADDNFIHLMRGDVDEEYKQKGVMTEMVKAVQKMYPDAELSFHNLSCEGREFVLKSFPQAKIRPFENGKYVKKTLPEYLKKFDNINESSDDNPCGC